MRNSPFQLKNNSLQNTIDSNAAYLHHKSVVSQYNRAEVSPKDFIESLTGKNDAKRRTRRFEFNLKAQEEERTNIRMLKKFFEI